MVATDSYHLHPKVPASEVGVEMVLDDDNEMYVLPLMKSYDELGLFFDVVDGLRQPASESITVEL